MEPTEHRRKRRASQELVSNDHHHSRYTQTSATGHARQHNGNVYQTILLADPEQFERAKQSIDLEFRQKQEYSLALKRMDDKMAEMENFHHFMRTTWSQLQSQMSKDLQTLRCAPPASTMMQTQATTPGLAVDVSVADGGNLRSLSSGIYDERSSPLRSRQAGRHEETDDMDSPHSTVTFVTALEGQDNNDGGPRPPVSQEHQSLAAARHPVHHGGSNPSHTQRYSNGLLQRQAPDPHVEEVYEPEDCAYAPAQDADPLNISEVDEWDKQWVENIQVIEALRRWVHVRLEEGNYELDEYGDAQESADDNSMWRTSAGHHVKHPLPPVQQEALEIEDRLIAALRSWVSGRLEAGGFAISCDEAFRPDGEPSQKDTRLEAIGASSTYVLRP